MEKFTYLGSNVLSTENDIWPSRPRLQNKPTVSLQGVGPHTLDGAQLVSLGQIELNCLLTLNFAHSAGAEEYTDSTSEEEKDYSNEYPEYDTKQSDGEVPVMLELWGMRSTP